MLSRHSWEPGTVHCSLLKGEAAVARIKEVLCPEIDKLKMLWLEEDTGVQKAPGYKLLC